MTGESCFRLKGEILRKVFPTQPSRCRKKCFVVVELSRSYVAASQFLAESLHIEPRTDHRFRFEAAIEWRHSSRLSDSDVVN